MMKKTKKFSRNRSILLIFTVLSVFLVSGLLLYSKTFEGPFIFDDITRIEENQSIRITELSAENLIEAAFGGQSAKARPIGNITFALNYYFHQYSPEGYHLVNIIIHILAGIVLFIFIQTTLNLPSLKAEVDHSFMVAFFAALLWLVHPIQTQSVTYIVQRLNSLAALFYILAFWLYVQGRLAAQPGKKWGWFGGAALAWIFALGCKQNAATLPFFILLYEWYFFQNLSVDWLKRKVKFVILVFFVFGLIAFLYLGPHPLEKLSSIQDFANNEFTLSERVLTQFRVVIYYISLIFFPHPSRLNLDYDFPVSTSLINPLATLPSLLVIVGLIGLAIYLAKKERLISFCVLWFFGNLAIESSIIPLAIIFEHRNYLPSMMVCLIPVILTYRYVKVDWLKVGLLSVLVVGLSVWTYQRNRVWQNEIALWTDVVEKSPNKARPHNNLGLALENQEMLDKAITHYQKALQINPNFYQAHHNLGLALADQGMIDKAIMHYQKALQINPNFYRAHINWGKILEDRGNLDAAIDHYLAALRINPGHSVAHNNLGVVLAKKGQLKEAINHFLMAIKINNRYAEPQFNLGAALAQQGKTNEAIDRFYQALRLNPDYAEPHNNLGGIFAQRGQNKKAIVHYTAALRLNPHLVKAYNNMGIALMNEGKIEEAINHFREALQIHPDFEIAENNLKRALAIRRELETEMSRLQKLLQETPDNVELYFQMGNLYFRKGDRQQAMQQYKKALRLNKKFVPAINNLALVTAANQEYYKALTIFLDVLNYHPDDAETHYNIACMYSRLKQENKSIEWLKKAIDKGYTNWESIKKDGDLDNIRETSEYKKLIEGR